jgi:hypothetical protein
MMASLPPGPISYDEMEPLQARRQSNYIRCMVRGAKTQPKSASSAILPRATRTAYPTAFRRLVKKAGYHPFPLSKRVMLNEQNRRSSTPFAVLLVTASVHGACQIGCGGDRCAPGAGVSNVTC